MKTWRKYWPWLAVAAWYGLIFFFSAQTGEASGEISDRLAFDLLRWETDNPWTLSEVQYALFQLVTFLLRKAAHMAVFFVLTALLLRALRDPLPNVRARTAAALGLCGVLAALDELHQRFVPGRSGQLKDVGIDLLGGLACLAFYFLLRYIRQRRRHAVPSEDPTP